MQVHLTKQGRINKSTCINNIFLNPNFLPEIEGHTRQLEEIDIVPVRGGENLITYSMQNLQKLPEPREVISSIKLYIMDNFGKIGSIHS